MKWSELINRVAERSGISKAATRRTLDALVAVTFEAVVGGEDVPLKSLGNLSSRWQDARTLRSVRDRRKMVIDGRYVPHIRISQKLKSALANRTPQYWRDPRHQAAWRVAEALIGDLRMYHAGKSPQNLTPNATPQEVQQACSEAFGPLWRQVVQNYQQRVPIDVRAQRQHLLLVARRQLATES